VPVAALEHDPLQVAELVEDEQGMVGMRIANLCITHKSILQKNPETIKTSVRKRPKIPGSQLQTRTCKE
jgi:hypothetical protein